MRTRVAAAALVGAVAAVLWLVALLSAAPPPAMALHVLGETSAVVGEPWPVRFGAVREGGIGPASLHGTIGLDAETPVDAAAGFARLVAPAPGTQGGALRICLDEGAPCAVARFAVDIVAARTPTRARFSWLGAAPPVDTVAAVARRHGVTVRMPLELDPSAPTFEVSLERSRGPLLLDVLVDGVVRDLVPAPGASVTLATPRGLAPGSVVVVHAGGVWPDELGAWATARAADPAEPLLAFVARLAREAGAPPELGAPVDEEAARALLGRLRPATLRASRLPLELVPEGKGLPWPELYLGAAALLVALVALTGRGRGLPPLTLAAGVGAVAAVCAGLYVVLLLLGR